MVPCDIKLSYCGCSWQTIRIEIGHNERGDADAYEECLPVELSAAFEALSFPQPAPLRVMKLSYQIAQKLHAVSEAGSERAHDLGPDDANFEEAAEVFMLGSTAHLFRFE